MNLRWWRSWWRTHVGMLAVGSLCAVTSVVLLVLCIERWRAPAFGIECQYISAALSAQQEWRAGRGMTAALFDWQWSVGNASLLGNLCAFPWLTLIPGRQSMLWLSTLLSASLAVLLLTRLINREGMLSSVSARALAEITTALLIWSMPLFMTHAVTFTAVPPALLAAVLALWVYRWAWRRDTRGAWCLASLVLLLSWWAKPEWGGVFIGVMLVVQCVDTWVTTGWRAGMTAVGVYSGVTPWVIFALYPWRPDRGSFALLGFLLLLAGAWLILLQRGGAAVQRTSAYLLPALAGVSAWLAVGNNGEIWLGMVRDSVRRYEISSPAWDILRADWYATPLALITVLGLAVLGIAQWWRRWPGLVIAGTLFGLNALLTKVEPEIQLAVFACIVACWAGVGFVEVVRQWQRMRGHFLPARTRGLILLGLLVLVLSWRLPHAIADLFVPAYRTVVPIFDSTRAGWEVITQVRATLPNDTTCAYTPDTPALSRLTLATYAQLYRWGWDVQPWPQDVTNATAAWLIILAPGKESAVTRYFPDPRVAEHCATQQAAVESSGRYRMARSASLAHGRFNLLVYQRAPLSAE